MRIQDCIAPSDEVLTLLIERAELRYLPGDPAEEIDEKLDLLAAVTEIWAELSACRYAWIERLRELGVDPKQCAQCPTWFARNDAGRHRLYCSEECKVAARRTR